MRISVSPLGCYILGTTGQVASDCHGQDWVGNVTAQRGYRAAECPTATQLCAGDLDALDPWGGPLSSHESRGPILGYESPCRDSVVMASFC